MKKYSNMRPPYWRLLNLKNRNLDFKNVRSMLEISYAGYPCPPPAISVQFTFKMCDVAENRKKSHSRSSKLINIKRLSLLLVSNKQHVCACQRHWSLFSTYWRFTSQIIIIIIMEIDQDNLRVKFSAMNVDYSSPSSDHLDSKRPEHAGVKKGYLSKKCIYPLLSCLAWKWHRHAAYHNKHWRYAS